MSQGFRNLQAWQRSKALAVAIYRLTDSAPFARDFALRDQMRRAAISVCSNLAEGDARHHQDPNSLPVPRLDPADQSLWLVWHCPHS